MPRRAAIPFSPGSSCRPCIETVWSDLTRPTRLWQWNEQELAACNFTDNIVQLMRQEAGRLPEATRRALALAGLLGHEFSTRVLALAAPELAGRPGDAHPLEPAVELGLLGRTSRAGASSMIAPRRRPPP